ncbi:hypothetical protein GCM10009785_30980 [Brooklawnia cerclae]
MIESLFGTTMATITTLGILLLIVIVAWHVAKRDVIKRWGLSMVIIGVLGLAVCFGAVFRDDYIDSVVATTDPSVSPGLFAADSPVSYVGYAGGAVTILALIAGAFLRKPEQRRVLFFVMAAAMFVKVVVVEGARLGV